MISGQGRKLVRDDDLLSLNLLQTRFLIRKMRKIDEDIFSQMATMAIKVLGEDHKIRKIANFNFRRNLFHEDNQSWLYMLNTKTKSKINVICSSYSYTLNAIGKLQTSTR